MSEFYLAELNVGQLLAPIDDPLVEEFKTNVERINGLGKRMPGFVWMMEGSGEGSVGNTGTQMTDDPKFVFNLTVWETPEQLETFVFGTLHKQFFQRRAEWFTVLDKMHFVMWWIPKGHIPTYQEAMDRLEDYRQNGPSERAFGWDQIRAARSS